MAVQVFLNWAFLTYINVPFPEVTIGTGQSSYSVTEYDDQQLTFNVNILSGEKGPGRSCVVTISTLEDSATGKCLLVSSWHGESTHSNSRHEIWPHQCIVVLAAPYVKTSHNQAACSSVQTFIHSKILRNCVEIRDVETESQDFRAIIHLEHKSLLRSYIHC